MGPMPCVFQTALLTEHRDNAVDPKVEAAASLDVAVSSPQNTATEMAQLISQSMYLINQQNRQLPICQADLDGYSKQHLSYPVGHTQFQQQMSSHESGRIPRQHSIRIINSVMQDDFPNEPSDPDTDRDDGPRYHIPHHAVTKEFEVTFNASAPIAGQSLNTIQFVGSRLQEDITEIVTRCIRREAAGRPIMVEKTNRRINQPIKMLLYRCR